MWSRPTEALLTLLRSLEVLMSVYPIDLETLFPRCPPSPFVLPLSPPPLLQGSLCPEGRDLMETAPLGLSVPRSLTTNCLAVGLYMSSHLPQEKTSLMMAKQGTEQQNVLRSHCIATVF